LIIRRISHDSWFSAASCALNRSFRPLADLDVGLQPQRGFVLDLQASHDLALDHRSADDLRRRRPVLAVDDVDLA
jgi:hypothetical protein